jgi:protein-S-isoprenylcysteine O-methyltransferase Ste14
LVRRSGVLNIPVLKAIAVVVLMGRMIVVASLILRIKHEDEAMKSISRAEWENWAKVVKYRLIPAIY